jgi:hypothetical protein
MSIKSFKEFVAEGTGASADELVPEKDSDKEATDYEPRSKGEKEFADKIKSDKKEKHPVAGDHVFTGDKKEVKK